jgi:heme oxygenase (biliverdin-IX-beta and delta-forming)
MNGANLDRERQVMRSVSASRTIEPRSTLDFLRPRTAKHHHSLESGLHVQSRFSAVETRGPLIAGYFVLHRETEAALSPHLWDMSDLALSSRVRSHRIPVKTGPPRLEKLLANPVFPAIGTKAEALGVLYVLDGATLGGKTILKSLRSQGVSTDDLHFLDPYGPQAGAYWRAFLSVLERETAHDQSTIEACVSGAIKAFAFAALCLREERTN